MPSEARSKVPARWPAGGRMSGDWEAKRHPDPAWSVADRPVEGPDDSKRGTPTVTQNKDGAGRFQGRVTSGRLGTPRTNS